MILFYRTLPRQGYGGQARMAHQFPINLNHGLHGWARIRRSEFLQERGSEGRERRG